MKKDVKNIVIIILSVIVVLLLFGIVLIYLKFEYLDDNDDFKIPINNSANTTDNALKDNEKENDNYISNNKALEIALSSLNISENDIYDLDIELDYKFGATVYEIDFKYNRLEYEFYINAQTGEILKSFSQRD